MKQLHGWRPLYFLHGQLDSLHKPFLASHVRSSSCPAHSHTVFVAQTGRSTRTHYPWAGTMWWQRLRRHARPCAGLSMSSTQGTAKTSTPHLCLPTLQHSSSRGFRTGEQHTPHPPYPTGQSMQCGDMADTLLLLLNRSVRMLGGFVCYSSQHSAGASALVWPQQVPCSNCQPCSTPLVMPHPLNGSIN